MLTFACVWVFLLAPGPLLIWYFVPPERDTGAAIRAPFMWRVQNAQHGCVAPATRNIAAGITQMVVWILLLAATARPQWVEEPISRTVPMRDLLLVVDLSGSMEAADFTDADGNAVDRLTVVKEVVGEFLTQREGDRVGLLVFGDAPYLQAPFTTDLELCRRLLDETAVRMAGPRTAFGDAIGLGIQTFAGSEVPERVMITLTDGNDTGSGVPPIEAARVARDRDVTIHTVGIGDPATVGEEELDLDTLQQVAAETGGRSFLALNRDELKGIYAQLDELEPREVETDYVRPRTDLFFLPLAAALVVSFCFHAASLRTLLQRRAPAQDVRLRVNSRTFDLETQDI